MTLIVTLPFCAPPPTARPAAVEPAADTAATGDPFATALAAALTAGLVTQPAVPANAEARVPADAAPAEVETYAPTPSVKNLGRMLPFARSRITGADTAATDVAPGTEPQAAVASAWRPVMAAPAPAESPVVTVSRPTAPALASADAPMPPAVAVAGTIEPLQSTAEPVLDGVAAAWPTDGTVTIERVFRLSSAASGRAQAPPAPAESPQVTVSTPTATQPATVAVAGTIARPQSTAEPVLDGVAAARPTDEAATSDRVFRLSSAASGRAQAPPAPAESPALTGSTPTATQPATVAVAGNSERLQSTTEPAPDGVAVARPTDDAATNDRVFRLSSATRAAATGADLGPPAVTDAAAQTPVAERADGSAPFDALSSLIDRVVRRMHSSLAQDDQPSLSPGTGASTRPALTAPHAEQTAKSAGQPIGERPVAGPISDDSAATTADADTRAGNADAWPPLHLIKFAPTNRGLKRTAWPDPPSTRATDARRVAPPAGNSATPAEEPSRPSPAVEPTATPGPILSTLAPSPHHGSHVTAEPIVEVAAAPAASEQAPLPTPNAVTLRVGEGDGETTRVRVTVRGDSVQTRIVAPDAPAAAQFAAASADLRSGLAQHGLTDAGASILAAPPSHAADRGASAAAPPATDVVAGTTSSRGTDAPSDRHSSDNKQRGEETATDRPGQHGSRSQQRSKRERER